MLPNPFRTPLPNGFRQAFPNGSEPPSERGSPHTLYINIYRRGPVGSPTAELELLQ